MSNLFLGDADALDPGTTVYLCLTLPLPYTNLHTRRLSGPKNNPFDCHKGGLDLVVVVVVVVVVCISESRNS